MPGGFITGLLRSFGSTAASERKLAADEQAKQDDRELRFLQWASQSDDEEIASRATTALFQIGAGVKRPKGGFLGALMGPTQPTVHPAMAGMLKLLQTPKEVPVEETVPAHWTSTGLPPGTPQPHYDLPPPPQGAERATPPPTMAMAPPATVEPPPEVTSTPLAPMSATPPPAATPPAGAPPGSAAMAPVPTPGSMGTPSAGPAGAKAPPPPPLPLSQSLTLVPQARRLTGATVSQPRQMFFTSTQRMFETKKAQARADIEGDVAGYIAVGFTPEQAREMVRADVIRTRGGSSGAPYQAIGLEIPDGKGGWQQIQGTFNRVTGDYEDMQGNPLPHARPKQSTGSFSAGANRESLSLATYGQRFATLTPEQQQIIIGKETQLIGQQAFARGTGSGDAAVLTAGNMPIGVSAAIELGTDPMRSLKSLTGFTLGRPVQANDVARLTELRDAASQAADLQQTLVGPGATGFAAWIQAAIPTAVSDLTGWGVGAKQRQAVIALTKQVIGKALEGGVLRKEDEIKYADILPTIGDTQEVAAFKLKMLANRIEQKRLGLNTELTQAGFNTAGPMGTSPPPSVTPAGTPPPAIGAAAGRAPAIGTDTISSGTAWDTATGPITEVNGRFIGHRPNGMLYELVKDPTTGKYTVK